MKIYKAMKEENTKEVVSINELLRTKISTWWASKNNKNRLVIIGLACLLYIGLIIGSFFW